MNSANAPLAFTPLVTVPHSDALSITSPRTSSEPNSNLSSPANPVTPNPPSPPRTRASPNSATNFSTASLAQAPPPSTRSPLTNSPRPRSPHTPSTVLISSNASPLQPHP